jgi:hypothetical protein
VSKLSNHISKQQIGYKKVHPPQPPLPAGLAMRRSGLDCLHPPMNAMQMRVIHSFPINFCSKLKTMFVHAFKHIALT